MSAAGVVRFRGVTSQTSDETTSAADVDALLALAKKGTWRIAVRTGSLVCSRSAAELHGPAFERGNQRAFDVLGALLPPDRDAVLDGLVEASANGFAWFEYSWFDDGVERRLRAFAVAERDGDGALEFKGLVEDVTDRMVAERVLLRARREADAASHAKSRFLANMSHEIRTPMNAVLGMTRLVLDTSLTDEQRDYLRAVERAARRSCHSSTTSSTSRRSKLASSSRSVASFGRPRCCTRVAMSLSVRAHEKGVEVVVDVDSRAAAIELEGDPRRFRQIITNVLGNAIKFTYAGEVVLEACESDGLLIIRVDDTGIGIPESELSAIFDPFRQVDAETTREFGGTGLGLSIARELVELMNGTIGVRSVVEQGSRFEIRIPLSGARHLPSPAPALSPPLPCRRLVADADARRRPHSSSRGGRFRRSCVHRHRGPAPRGHAIPNRGLGLELVIEQDLLGTMSGIELAHRIRGLPGVRSVTLLTRFSARFSPGELHDAGVTSVLRKPVRPDVLTASLITRGSPQLVANEAARKTAAKQVEPRPIDLVSAAERCVLVVEDEELNARLVCAILRKLAFTPVHVRNGREAVDAARRQRFLAILMDLQIPVLDGLEATVLIRQHEAGSGTRTPVIALTANAMSGDRERCIGAGMDHYLSKPISARDLGAILRHYEGAAAAAQSA